MDTSTHGHINEEVLLSPRSSPIVWPCNCTFISPWFHEELLLSRVFFMYLLWWCMVVMQRCSRALETDPICVQPDPQGSPLLPRLCLLALLSYGGERGERQGSVRAKSTVPALNGCRVHEITQCKWRYSSPLHASMSIRLQLGQGQREGEAPH